MAQETKAIPTQKEFVSAGLKETFVLRGTKVADKFTIAARQSVYLRGMDPKVINREAQDFSYICATLGVVLVSPPTYDFSEVRDETALLTLWEEWDEWNRSFRSPEPGAAK